MVDGESKASLRSAVADGILEYRRTCDTVDSEGGQVTPPHPLRLVDTAYKLSTPRRPSVGAARTPPILGCSSVDKARDSPPVYLATVVLAPLAGGSARSGVVSGRGRRSRGSPLRPYCYRRGTA